MELLKEGMESGAIGGTSGPVFSAGVLTDGSVQAQVQAAMTMSLKRADLSSRVSCRSCCVSLCVNLLTCRLPSCFITQADFLAANTSMTDEDRKKWEYENQG